VSRVLSRPPLARRYFAVTRSPGLALDGALSVSVKIEPKGAAGTAGTSTSSCGDASCVSSQREAHSQSVTAAGGAVLSAGIGRRLSGVMQGALAGGPRHSRSCGCTPLATGSHPSPPKSPPHLAFPTPSAMLLQHAGPARQDGARISTGYRFTCRDRSSPRSAYPKRPMSISAGLIASWRHESRRAQASGVAAGVGFTPKSSTAASR